MNRNDALSGSFFVALGGVYAGVTLATMPVGQAENMGPGYFPIVLSGMLAFFGLVTVTRSFRREKSLPFGIIPWRAMVMLPTATLIFAAFLDDLGLFPAVFLTTLIGSLSSQDMKPLHAIASSIGISILCVGIFHFGIRLPIPLIGPWLGGR